MSEEPRIDLYLASVREAEAEMGAELGAEPMEFAGPCPFLTCIKTEPHTHFICPLCGAVKFGNISCPTCRSVHERVRAKMERRA